MSLINQALKLEQQRRQSNITAMPPMVAQAAYRGRRNGHSGLLLVITGIGATLAVSILGVLHFGKQGTASDVALASNPQASVATSSASGQAQNDVGQLLGTLSPEELSTVQKMLAERAESEPEAATEQLVARPTETTLNEAKVAEITRIQDIVDALSVQGIRKAGQDTRVFLDGKIRRIGEVIDLEHGLRLIGFTDEALLLATPDGRRYSKPL